MQDDMTQHVPLRVAYLGPPASFSHQAAREAFSQSPSVIHQSLPSFAAIFLAIQNGSSQSQGDITKDPPADFAVLPVENSTNGGVVQVLDLLIQCGLDPATCSYPDIEVVAEHYLEVHHNLFVHPSALTSNLTDNNAENKTSSDLEFDLSKLNITNIYTHPQVWGQCGKFLSRQFPPLQTERTDVSSTSAAALLVAQTPPSNNTTEPESNIGLIAAISSSLAGEQNKLLCLASNIEDEPGKNTTRFLVIRNRKRNSSLSTPTYLIQANTHQNQNQPHHPQKPTRTYLKSLITFTIPHTQPGSLASALAVFQTHNFNLTAITTRPSRERNWHYVFFVECEDSRDITINNNKMMTTSSIKDVMDNDERFQLMLLKLEFVTERMCLLGSWVDRLRHG